MEHGIREERNKEIESFKRNLCDDVDESAFVLSLECMSNG
jgi:hypothetical protein